MKTRMMAKRKGIRDPRKTGYRAATDSAPISFGEALSGRVVRPLMAPIGTAKTKK